MISFNDYFTLLTEGGAGGHMLHPFDLPSIDTGNDLIELFNRAVLHIQEKSAAVKIDGVNVSVRLITNYRGQKEFAIDRGSMKDIDLEGVTLERLEERWPDKLIVSPGTQDISESKHGMVKAGQILLSILNEAIPFIEPELKKLKLWDSGEPTVARFLNIEFVSTGGNNVIKYGKNFLAFHGVNQFKLNKTGKSRAGVELSDTAGEPRYNVNAFARLIEKVSTISRQKDFDTHGVVSVSFTRQPDFAKVLNTRVTIVNTSSDENTRTLDMWLSQAKNPLGEKAVFADGIRDNVMKKSVYLYVIGDNNRSTGPLLDKFKDDNENIKNVIDAAVFWHATRLLGIELLSCLETSFSEHIPVGEGIVIRGMRPTPRSTSIYPTFKITGDFIVNTIQSQFAV